MSSWKRPAAAIVALTIVADGFMVLTNMGPDLVLVTTLCILVGVALWSIFDLMNAAVEVIQLAAIPAPQPVQATDRRVMRLRGGLVYGRRDGTSLERLRTSLVELLDDQLRAAYQIDRVADPAAARAVLGAELSAFIDDPRAAQRLARPQQLDRVLTLIERI